MAVLCGSVKISSLSAGGKEIVFTIFNAGDIFGEIAVLDGDERSADATAMTDCELLVLNRRDFLPVLEDHADLCMILLRLLCRRLRQTTEQVEDVMFLHLESRVAKALLQLVESVGLRALHSPSVELHVSQRELGNMAGGSRESVNKIFQNWHRRGLIDLSKGSIMIRTWKPSSALSKKSAPAELNSRAPARKPPRPGDHRRPAARHGRRAATTRMLSASCAYPPFAAPGRGPSRDLARQMADTRTMLTASWSLQRGAAVGAPQLRNQKFADSPLEEGV